MYRDEMLYDHSSKEAELMRLFYGLSGDTVMDSQVVNTDIIDGSCVTSCHLGDDKYVTKPTRFNLYNLYYCRNFCNFSNSEKRGFVKGSVLTSVRCNHIEAEGCVLINVTAERIIAAPGSVVYNVVASGDDKALVVGPGQVLAGVFSDDGSLHVLRSEIEIDGGKAWETVLANVGNTHSFEQIYKKNADTCPLTLERVIFDSHSEAWDQLSPAKESNTSSKKIKITDLK